MTDLECFLRPRGRNKSRNVVHCFTKLPNLALHMRPGPLGYAIMLARRPFIELATTSDRPHFGFGFRMSTLPFSCICHPTPPCTSSGHEASPVRSMNDFSAFK